MAGFHQFDHMRGRRVPGLHHHQARRNAVAQDALHRLGHGRASLARAEHEDAAELDEIEGQRTDAEGVLCQLELGTDRSKGIDGLEGGGEDGQIRCEVQGRWRARQDQRDEWQATRTISIWARTTR